METTCADEIRLRFGSRNFRCSERDLAKSSRPIELGNAPQPKHNDRYLTTLRMLCPKVSQINSSCLGCASAQCLSLELVPSFVDGTVCTGVEFNLIVAGTVHMSGMHMAADPDEVCLAVQIMLTTIDALTRFKVMPMDQDCG